jgi:hypothetical protein
MMNYQMPTISAEDKAKVLKIVTSYPMRVVGAIGLTAAIVYGGDKVSKVIKNMKQRNAQLSWVTALHDPTVSEIDEATGGSIVGHTWADMPEEAQMLLDNDQDDHEAIKHSLTVYFRQQYQKSPKTMMVIHLPNSWVVIVK